MLYVAGQQLESIGRLEEARSAYRRALEATMLSQPQKPLDHRDKAPALSQGLSGIPDVDSTRATVLYHLAHAFLLEAGRETEAVESAIQAVELSSHSGKFAIV
jgi:tetratricopeptide (TPR) repeat protein